MNAAPSSSGTCVVLVRVASVCETASDRMIYVRERERGGGGSGLRLGTKLAQTRRATACGGSCAVSCPRPESRSSVVGVGRCRSGRQRGQIAARGGRCREIYGSDGRAESASVRAERGAAVLLGGKMERHEEAIISCAISRRAPPSPTDAKTSRRGRCRDGRRERAAGCP